MTDVSSLKGHESVENTPLRKDEEATSYNTPGVTQDPEGQQTKGTATLLDPVDDIVQRGKNQYAPFLDVTRIVCVACVVIDHGYRPFGKWNALFTQDWVLQYIYLVSGVCFGLSKNFLKWEVRLSVYLVLGIFCNWLAWVIAGRQWRGNMFNVVFHMWFIVGLMGYGIVLYPLRAQLEKMRRRAEHGDSQVVICRPIWGLPALVLGLFFFGLVFLKGFEPLLVRLLAPVMWRLWGSMGEGAAYWGLPDSPDASKDFIAQISRYLLLTCSNVFLILVSPSLLSGRISLTGWIVFLNTYLHRLAVYRSGAERPFHGLDLMMLAVTVYYLGLWRRQQVGRYFARYWFVVIFVLALAWRYGTYRRFDEIPPEGLENRLRVNFIEGLLVLSWLVAGDRMVQPEIFTEDKLNFLDDWALLAFLIHEAVHIAVPAPFNWVVLVACVLPCWLYHKRLKGSKSAP